MNNDLAKKKYDNNNIENYFKNNLVLGRGIVAPCQKNPFSVYNETFAETEIRKLGRKKGEPTKTKKSGNKIGNPNRASCILGEDALLFGHVGYTIENPSIGNIKNADFCKYGTGEGKRSFIHGNTNNLQRKFNVPLEERGRILHEVTLLRSEIRKYLANKGIKVQEERKEFFRIKKELKRLPRDLKKRALECLSKLGYGKSELEYIYLLPTEVTLNIGNDDKIKYVYVTKSKDVMSTEKTYDDGYKMLMAVYLRDKFKEKLNRNLQIISLGNGEKTKLEYVDNYRIAYYLNQILDETILSREKIALINHFSDVIKNDRRYSLKDKVIVLLKKKYENLPQKVFYERLDDYYFNINLAKSMKTFGLNKEGDQLLLKYLRKLPENLRKLNSDFIRSVKNVAITRNKDFRFENGLHKIMLRGDYDILKIKSYLVRIKNEFKSESYKIISKEKKSQVDTCFGEVEKSLNNLYPLMDKLGGKCITSEM